jgi:hypothetical protein
MLPTISFSVLDKTDIYWPIQQGRSVVNPGHYISHARHKFETCYVSKTTAEADIDEICKHGYDMFLNYMVRAARPEKDNVTDRCE